MRSKELSLEHYDTDKISHQYLERYDPVFQDWVDKSVSLLELGVLNAGSVQLWRDYFPQGTITGIDLKLPSDFKPLDRIQLYQGSQSDLPFLNHVASQAAPQGFDIIIDDASHLGAISKISFWHLFDNHLKPGGIYVIEDWGTGYWDDWPDGQHLDTRAYAKPERIKRNFLTKVINRLGIKSRKQSMPCHSYGMVGFIKQLVDEQGASDASRNSQYATSVRGSKFESMLVTPSIVFVRKCL